MSPELSLISAYLGVAPIVGPEFKVQYLKKQNKTHPSHTHTKQNWGLKLKLLACEKFMLGRRCVLTSQKESIEILHPYPSRFHPIQLFHLAFSKLHPL
jgi:hypothetical protein